ncbi:MAG: hypothetical protein K6T35_07760 [Meiothermus silvanus]|nr:hypothetical protein [Allomeiothermus silvanus]
MKHKDVEKARQRLARQLPDPTQILRGSLLERRIFHQRGCARCARGEGHRVWVLTVSYAGGRTRQISLSPEQKPLAERWLRNYRKLRQKLEAICELNQQLLRGQDEE